MRKAYWWGKITNFGDQLNPLILRKMDVPFDWAKPSEAELVMVGSILEHLPADWSGTVFGAGQLHESSRIDLTNARVLALRGKLTAARVKGLPSHTRVVLGDPGLLAPLWVRQPPAKYDLGIVPHWSDKELFKRYPYAHLIDPQQQPEHVIEEIASCKRIIASSLHGLIIADAYGIPRQAELFPRASQEGGDFKYRDYCSVYDESPHFGEMWLAPHRKVEKIRDDLNAVLPVAIGRPSNPKQPLPAAPKPVGAAPHISLLVPFRDNGEFRTKAWAWLEQYWTAHLPSAEIVVGRYTGTPFNKAAAVNDAASRARGRVFVVCDADAYMDSQVVQNCANNIDAAVKTNQKLWYIPYNKLYRLAQATTQELLFNNPAAPFAIPTPPPESWLESSGMATHDVKSRDYGHHYGAMMQIMPAEAFFQVGGMDPRFAGWGSEDVSFMKALDTLYGQHEITQNEILHLWHVRPGVNWATRRWVGQLDGIANSRLAQRYALASGERAFMRGLVDEHVQPVPCARRRGWFRGLFAA
jgi:hypothetical protein